MKQEKNEIKKFTKGFTLLELLVVVLIIGILAGIALPQYKIAVTKSKFAALKEITRGLLEAEERYFLINNDYTSDINSLDFNYKAGNSGISCYLVNYEKGAVYVACHNNKIKLQYQIYPKHVFPYTVCVYNGEDSTSASYQVCKQEAGGVNHSQHKGSQYIWYY